MSNYLTVTAGAFLAVLLAASLATDARAAERIWDSELRRYLTEEEMSHAEVFMTEEDAVKIMLPKSQRVRKEILRLSPDQKILIESRIG